MAKLWAPWHGAWEVLAFSATVAVLVVLTERGGVARPTRCASLVVLAESGGVALSTRRTVLVVRAEAGSATRPTIIALNPM